MFLLCSSYIFPSEKLKTTGIDMASMAAPEHASLVVTTGTKGNLHYQTIQS